MENINLKLKNATKWSVFTEIIVKIISPLTNLILARLLAPEAFGVVATVTMIISFSDLFTDAGFQKFIIQNKFNSSDDMDISVCVAFWSNIIISIFLWILICIFSDNLAILTGNEGLGNVIRISSISLIFTSFSSIQIALYTKNFNFKLLSFTRITTKIIPFIITIPLARLGYSYWALIIGNLIGEFINALILTILSNWKPKLKYKFKTLLNMISFCGWTFMESISGWLVSNISIFIIGLYFTDYYLGIYKASITTVSQIVSIISASTIRVLFTTLSSVQNDSYSYNKIILNFQKYVGMFSIPLGAGILIFRDTITLILLGNSWLEASLLIGLWGFVICESIIFADFGAVVMLSKGKPRYIFISNFVQILILIPTLLYSSSKGFLFLVCTICLVRIQLPLMQTFWTIKFTKLNIKDICINIRQYIVATVIMSIIAYALRTIKTNIILDIFYIVICIVLYFLMLCLIPDNRRMFRLYLNSKIDKCFKYLNRKK